MSQRNADNIPDPSGDFRDRIDYDLFGEEVVPANPQKQKLTPEQIHARKAYRLPQNMAAYLILEIITTNKTDKAIAEKFGISRQSVTARRKRIRKVFKRQNPQILYRKDGTLFFA